MRKAFRIIECPNGFKIYIGRNLVAWAKKDINTKEAKSSDSCWIKENLLLVGIHPGGGIQSPITFNEFLGGWLSSWMANSITYYLFQVDRRNDKQIKELDED